MQTREEINKVRNIRRQKRKEEGNCLDCGKPSFRWHLCEKHYHKKIARHYRLRYKVKFEDLLELFIKQNGKCAISGVEITIGCDASVDHIVPKVAGGKNELSNYQWVHKKVNLYKRCHNQEEFISWCKIIANYNTTQSAG